MKDNELIAEFDGVTKIHQSIYLRVSTGEEFLNLKYDISWDWLMPVVSRCLRNNKRYGEELEINDISIHDSRDTIYIAVVEFIKWYNKYKETT